MPYWTSSCGKLELELTLDEAQNASHSGECKDDAEALLVQPHVASQVDAWDADDLREHLSEYGAWDDDELQDDDTNRVRQLWLACGDIVDGNV